MIMKLTTEFKKKGIFSLLAVITIVTLNLIPCADNTFASEEAGNNLSYPVIWSEGIQKVLPGLPDMDPVLNGEWWYWWGFEGTDPDITPLSCLPDPDDETFCDDGISGQATGSLPGSGWMKAYVQKDSNNTWQAGSADWSASSVAVDFIDWGDNLESVDWYTRSMVRTEIVLFQDLDIAMREYEMLHVSGWGIDETHGLAVDDAGPVEGPGDRATVYSPCARLTIQKLLVDRSNPALSDLVWVPQEGWTEPEGATEDLINPFLFNSAVHEAEDGSGFFNAEINVKGRIIYGFTWNVRESNQGPGDYRITFSFDESCGEAQLNTFFTEGITQIIVPDEEDIEAARLIEALESTTGGATAVLDYANNLSFIDVRILVRGNNGGNGGGGNGGGGGNTPPN